MPVNLAQLAFVGHLMPMDVLHAMKVSSYTSATVSPWIALLIWPFITLSAALKSWHNSGLMVEFLNESIRDSSIDYIIHLLF